MTNALATLAKHDAHFVLCRGKRAFMKGWQKTPPPLDAARRHKGRVGVIPASVGCIVVDIDRGGDEALAQTRDTLGVPIAVVKSQKPGRYHVWYQSRDASQFRKGEWRYGDLIGSSGYAVLWHADELADGLERAKTHPVADLILADLDRLPPKPNGGEVGNRNNTLNRNGYVALRNGQPVEPHIEDAIEAGLPKDEARRTTKSFTEAAERDGVRTPVDDPWSPRGLEFCFASLDVGLRLNIRAKRYEYRLNGQWLEADDERDAKLRQELIPDKFSCKKGSTWQRLKYSPDMFYDLRLALGDGLRSDPFLEWVKALPPWDRVPRIDGLLTDMFGAEDDSLTRWASRYIGIGAIQRAFKPGAKIDEVPVLLSQEQGIGKSAFVRSWFSEASDEWHGDAVDLSARAKEQAEQLAGRVVVELSELTGIRKAEVERLKSFITRQDDGQFRWAYARSSKRSPRMCVFVGTTNSSNCLPNDPSGNRRFVVVELQHGCDVEARAEAERELWWSEALARYQDGERANLPRDLHETAAERAEVHRDADAGEDQVEEALVDLEPSFTLVELHEVLRNVDPEQWGRQLDTGLQMRLGRALGNLGCTRRRVMRHGSRKMLWSKPEQIADEGAFRETLI